MRSVVAVSKRRRQFTASSSVVRRRRKFPGSQGCVHVAEQRAQDGYALHDYGADNFGGVPDVGMRIAPEVPCIFLVAFVFPTGADCRYDRNNHSL
jgi:hypothetical protein